MYSSELIFNYGKFMNFVMLVFQIAPIKIIQCGFCKKLKFKSCEVCITSRQIY